MRSDFFAYEYYPRTRTTKMVVAKLGFDIDRP